MNRNLEIWKGSCGYAAPGRTGTKGEDGNSIHFSSIDTSTNGELVKNRILSSQSLTDNNDAISEEKYKVDDYILDTFGQLSAITSITSSNVQMEMLGNIAFPEKPQGYTVPTNSNEATLQFTIDRNLTYPFYTNNGQNSYIQRNPKVQDEWKLWRYRYYGNKTYGSSKNLPSGYRITPSGSTSYKLTGKNDEGVDVTYPSTKSFIEYVANNEEYCKICAVLNNGLVVESIPTKDSSFGIFIEKGYIESIDKNLTTLEQYTSFQHELNATHSDSSIKEAIKSNTETSMCNMYFEYSHKGEVYRMNINVT